MTEIHNPAEPVDLDAIKARRMNAAVTISIRTCTVQDALKAITASSDDVPAMVEEIRWLRERLDAALRFIGPDHDPERDTLAGGSHAEWDTWEAETTRARAAFEASPSLDELLKREVEKT